MKINDFVWNNYKNSPQGQKAIIQYDLDSEEKILDFLQLSHQEDNDDIQEKLLLILDIEAFYLFPYSKKITEKSLFESIINDGIILKDNDQNQEILFNERNEEHFILFIEEITCWLHLIFPDFFFPYLFPRNFRFLKRICDNFGIKLPPIPKKLDKRKRALYYFELCNTFVKFKKLNNFNASEFNAFLYDFAPAFIGEDEDTKLPPATHIWAVGGNKHGVDLNFLESSDVSSNCFWQGNLDTKQGDIVIMYCLSPLSAIHSIWRATEDGLADPFFSFYSSIKIGHPVKIPPIKLAELKQHSYFKNHSKVRANMQGINGYQFNQRDYAELIKILETKEFDTSQLPKLYQPEFTLNIDLKSERDVEINLLEPLLKKIGYTESDWKRQIPIRMGRGERNYPDYAIFPNLQKGYESCDILIEAKYAITSNNALEDTFVQAHSYALRLQSKLIVICDKNAIWVFPKTDKGFDRTNYTKRFWRQLEQIEDYNAILHLIGKKYQK